MPLQAGSKSIYTCGNGSIGKPDWILGVFKLQELAIRSLKTSNIPDENVGKICNTWRNKCNLTLEFGRKK